MISLQRVGAVAALYMAAAYLAGIVLFLVVLDYPSVVDPVQKVALLAEHQTVIYITNLLMYVVFGILLVFLALALSERLAAASPAVVRAATIIGCIWAGALVLSGMAANAGIAPVVALRGEDPAQAAAVWMAIESVTNGLGGANGEVLGGVFTLLVCGAARRANEFPRGLNGLGLAVGGAGVLSTVPGLGGLAGLFGATGTVWFAWLGIVLLRPGSGAAAQDRRLAAGRSTEIASR